MQAAQVSPTTPAPEGAVHGPRDLESFADDTREQLGRDLESAESCYQLWVSVVELALRDLAFVEQVSNSDELTPHETSKLNRILEHDPSEFLEQEWFEEICRYLDVSPQMIRREARRRAEERH